MEPEICSSEQPAHHEPCPLCGEDNHCRVAKGHLYKGPCWCHEIIVPGQILTQLAAEQIEPTCLCRPCLETVAQVSREVEGTEAALSEVRRLVQLRKIILSNPEDFYLDEFGLTVFTAAYHLRRGNCCGSGCRHCPY